MSKEAAYIVSGTVNCIFLAIYVTGFAMMYANLKIHDVEHQKKGNIALGISLVAAVGFGISLTVMDCIKRSMTSIN